MNAAERRPFGVVAVVMLTVLVACGKPQQPGDADPATKLTVSVTADEGAAPVEMTLECDPPGGDHPQPAEACEKIKSAGVKVFDPVAKDQACTMIYGGPQTATVVGTYDGTPINATFNRTNGCEIDRWEKLGTTFFDVPLQ